MALSLLPSACAWVWGVLCFWLILECKCGLYPQSRVFPECYNLHLITNFRTTSITQHHYNTALTFSPSPANLSHLWPLGGPSVPSFCMRAPQCVTWSWLSTSLGGQEPRARELLIFTSLRGRTNQRAPTCSLKSLEVTLNTSFISKWNSTAAAWNFIDLFETQF